MQALEQLAEAREGSKRGTEYNHPLLEAQYPISKLDQEIILGI